MKSYRNTKGRRYLYPIISLAFIIFSFRFIYTLNTNLVLKAILWVAWLATLDFITRALFSILTKEVVVFKEAITESFTKRMMKRYEWNNLYQKKIDEKNGKINSITLYFKDKKRPLILFRILEDFDSLLDEIEPYIKDVKVKQ